MKPQTTPRRGRPRRRVPPRQVLEEIAGDLSQPAAARVSAAKALIRLDRDAAAVAAKLAETVAPTKAEAAAGDVTARALRILQAGRLQ